MEEFKISDDKTADLLKVVLSELMPNVDINVISEHVNNTKHDAKEFFKYNTQGYNEYKNFVHQNEQNVINVKDIIESNNEKIQEKNMRIKKNVGTNKRLNSAERIKRMRGGK